MAADTPVTFDAKVRDLLDGKSFATVATLQPDGSPQATVVWIERDDDTVQFSTSADRRKARNLKRDPRISVNAYLPEDPYTAVEIRGRAELIDDPQRELPMRLSRKYTGQDWPEEGPEVHRLIVRVHPTKVVVFAG